MPVFDGENLLVTLDATGGVGTVDVQVDLYAEWKGWLLENGPDGSSNRKYPQAFSPDGGNALTPGITQGQYAFIRNDLGWRIRPAEEDATIYFTGNLIPQDATLPIVVPTIGAYTVLMPGLQPITQSVAPLLILQQETSYNGIIHVDLVSGTPGTSFPTGTASEPCSNMTDAFAIGALYGIREYHGRGNLTATGALDDLTLEGFGIPASIDFDGYTANATELANLAATGDMASSQSCVFRNCTISGLTNVSGAFVSCVFTGVTALVPPPVNEQNYIAESASFVPGTGMPSFDLQGLEQDLQLRGWVGGVEILNCTNAANKISIDVHSGNVILGASNTAGTIVVRGVGTLTDNTGPSCTVIPSMLSPDSVAAAILHHEVKQSWTRATSGGQQTTGLRRPRDQRRPPGFARHCHPGRDGT